MNIPLIKPHQALALIFSQGIRGSLKTLSFWAILILNAIPLAAAIYESLANDGMNGIQKMVFLSYLGMLIPLIASLRASFIIADSMHNKSAVYLFTRPVPRWSLLLGGTLSQVTITLPIVLLITGMIFQVLLPTPKGTSYMLALAAGLMSYQAIAATISILFPKRPFLTSIIFLYVIEGGLSAIPGNGSLLSIKAHLINIGGLEMDYMTMFGQDSLDVPLLYSWLYIIALTAFVLYLGIRKLNNAELKP